MIAGAVLVTAIACSRCLGNGFVVDDNALIVHNSAIAGWSFPWKSLGREEFWFGDYSDMPHFRNYRPLLLVWLWLNYHLFGLSAPWWHASIIAVHLAAVSLVFKIAKRLTREPGSALLAAFLFGLIPVHGQALAWMAACGLVLSTTLELAAFYLIMIRSEAELRNWALALAFYAAALLCHESAIVFPGLVACYAFLIESPADTAAGSVAQAPEPFPARARRALLCAAPLAVDLLIYLIVRRMVLGVLFKASFEPANLLTPAQDVMTVPMVLAIYLTLLVAPWLALPNHRVLPVTSVASPGFWMPLGALLALGAVLLMVWRRSSRRGLYLFCAAWVGLSLTPMMGLRALYHLVQDMYLYLPSVGWCILLAGLVGRFSHRGLLPRRLALGGATALLGVYAVALWRVVPFWHDDVTAAAGYVAGFPESVVWHGNLAMMLEKQGDSAGAERQLRTALALEPDRTGTLHPDSAALHVALGELLASRGDIDGAAIEFKDSLGPDDPGAVPQSPGAADDPIARAGALQQRGDLAGAQRELEAELAVNPADARALYSLGAIEAQQGHIREGIAEVSRALPMMKNPPATAYVALADLYDLQQDHVHSEQVLREVESLPQGEATAAMARATELIRHGDRAGAMRILRALTESHPVVPSYWVALAELQAGENQNQEALASYRQALENLGNPNPADNSALHFRIAKLLHALGRDREAFDQCRLALALAPGSQAIKEFKGQLDQSLAGRDR